MDGKTFDGSKIAVEWAGGVLFKWKNLIKAGEGRRRDDRNDRGRDRDRDRDRNGSKGDVCYNCGKKGHW